MGKKYFRDWQNFVDSAGELLNENMRKCRVTLKYRNKLPSYGKLYVTDDNKSKYIKLDKKSDLDKIEIKEASKTESKNENKKKSQKRKK